MDAPPSSGPNDSAPHPSGGPRWQRYAVTILTTILLTAITFYFYHPAPERVVLGKLHGIIEDDSSLEMFEGLPSLWSEKEFHVQALAGNDTFQVHGYPFFKEKISISPEVEKRFREISSSSSTYARPRGAKECGGFHPDYAMIWHAKKQHVTILLCLGCEEALIAGDELTVHVDLTPKSADAFKEVLRSIGRPWPPQAGP